MTSLWLGQWNRESLDQGGWNSLSERSSKLRRSESLFKPMPIVENSTPMVVSSFQDHFTTIAVYCEFCESKFHRNRNQRTSGSFLQEIFNLMYSESSDNGKNRTDFSVTVRGGYHACPGKPMKARMRACYHQESRRSSGEGISPFVDPFAVGS